MGQPLVDCGRSLLVHPVSVTGSLHLCRVDGLLICWTRLVSGLDGSLVSEIRLETFVWLQRKEE